MVACPPHRRAIVAQAGLREKWRTWRRPGLSTIASGRARCPLSRPLRIQRRATVVAQHSQSTCARGAVADARPGPSGPGPCDPDRACALAAVPSGRRMRGSGHPRGPAGPSTQEREAGPGSGDRCFAFRAPGQGSAVRRTGKNPGKPRSGVVPIGVCALRRHSARLLIDCGAGQRGRDACRTRMARTIGHPAVARTRMASPILDSHNGRSVRTRRNRRHDSCRSGFACRKSHRGTCRSRSERVFAGPAAARQCRARTTKRRDS